MAIRGSYAAMPRGRGWPRGGRFPVSVRYGPAIRSGPDEDVRSFSDRARAAIGRLLDEDGSTWWESLRRASNGDDPGPRVHGPEGARWRRVWAATAAIEGGRTSVWERRR